jgi:amino acid adenylation domain-containing protein
MDPILPTDGASGVHDLVAAQAARTPDAIAVTDARTSVTYAELMTRANRLSRHLRLGRFESESRVAIWIAPSVEFVSTTLGVLAAGGAYVPVDLGQPTTRLAAIIADIEPSTVVTTRAAHWLVPPTPARVVDLDGDHEEIAGHADHGLGIHCDPRQLAYVMYTSGSTGRPKGVLVTHGGLSNYLRWASAAYGFDRSRNALVHTSPGVDLTVTALWGPLLGGGTVEFLDKPDLETLASRIHVGALGVLKVTPTHLRALSGTERPSLADVLVVGGEPLMGRDLDAWRRVAPEMLRINEYGPTETVVGSCAYRDSPTGGPGSVPIGQPIANTQAYVLDDSGEPVPIGEDGELCLGGAGVARGYWNRPADTAMRFVPDPFGAAGGRLYRTGDRVRRLPSGDMVFLGRMDQQVKVRGHRVEVGEIEASLVSTGLVRDAVVVLRESAAGPQLVAYAVARHNEPPDVAVWRRALQARVPEPMVPSIVVAVDEWPLTPSGKIDRQALALRLPVTPAPGGIAPRDELERRVHAIWSSVLDVHCSDVRANFYDLGANSLSVVILARRLAQSFGADLPFRAVTDHPTIESMAGYLRVLLADAPSADASRPL